MVILIQCIDKVGLVASIAGVLARRNINIISMREYVDQGASRFFARLETAHHPDTGLLLQDLQAVLPGDATIKVNPEPEKKIILLVTREYHCLSDILVRHHFKNLGASVECVIGNYDILKNICDRFEVPFHTVSHDNRTRGEFEKEILQIIKNYQHDYIVLAKFMRILSHEFVDSFPTRIINIHHSFLPAFAGAHPYKQAFLRGVKIIGATAHFVTSELDEGPIIEQQIIHVDHTYSISDMISAGKEIERAVLARALKLVLEDRVFVYDNKTVVFE